MYAYKIREAQQEMMNIARIGNKYLADEEPWKKIKNDPDRVATILNIAIQITRELARMAQLFIPETAAKIYGMLGVSPDTLQGEVTPIPAGHPINQPEILFEKITDELVAEEKQKLTHAAPKQTPYPAMKELIQFDDFTKMDIRLGKVFWP